MLAYFFSRENVEDPATTAAESDHLNCRKSISHFRSSLIFLAKSSFREIWSTFLRKREVDSLFDKLGLPLFTVKPVLSGHLKG